MIDVGMPSDGLRKLIRIGEAIDDPLPIIRVQIRCPVIGHQSDCLTAVTGDGIVAVCEKLLLLSVLLLGKMG